MGQQGRDFAPAPEAKLAATIAASSRFALMQHRSLETGLHKNNFSLMWQPVDRAIYSLPILK
jgi:hypothetical protein